jgi:ribonuclease-3
LARQVGVKASSEVLLVALTHSSFAAENGVESNERLEFLGDAVVDLAVADAIIKDYPQLNQGTGSLTRSKVVNESSLAEAAERLDLGRYVRLGRGEIKIKGHARPSLLADTFEAVVAAVYLERGYDAARDFVIRELDETLREAAAAPDEVDPKSRLRHWAEAAGLGTPYYEVTSEGPSHDKEFVAEVRIGEVIHASGRGRSKKAAEVAAALSAWGGRDNA